VASRAVGMCPASIPRKRGTRKGLNPIHHQGPKAHFPGLIMSGALELAMSAFHHFSPRLVGAIGRGSDSSLPESRWAVSTAEHMSFGARGRSAISPAHQAVSGRPKHHMATRV